MMLLSDLYLWLSYSGVSTHKLNRLLESFTPFELWDGLGGERKNFTFDDKTYNSLKFTRSEEYIARAKNYLEINHIEYVTRADPIYPAALSQREVDPPLVLYYKGDINILRSPCFAVVGTRNASQYGKFVTEKTVRELAKYFAIVSGLATGIDGYAHRAALDAGGKTVAVLGSGLFNVTPVSNHRLFDEICRNGLVLSEYTPDVHGSVYTFPQRNRIISGLSRGVLVAEAAERSGSLITANCALDQGRDVFAVPGDIDKPRSVGTNSLLKQGATPVTNAYDIFEFYGISDKTLAEKTATVSLDFFEQAVLDILTGGEKTFDELVASSKLSVPQLSTTLSTLMIYGLVHEKAKNLFCATVA